MDVAIYRWRYEEEDLYERDFGTDKIRIGVDIIRKDPSFGRVFSFFVHVTCKPEKTEKPF
jgi:hypothetical protein